MQTPSPQINDIRSQLRTFINLLQSGQASNHKSFKSTGKLSVILSASEPQSSSYDKQNSNHSANKAIENSQFSTTEKSQINIIIKELLKSGLTKHQQKLLNNLAYHIQQIHKKSQISYSKTLILQQQLSRQKNGTDQLLQALIKMDQQSKQQWNTYYQLSDKYTQLQKQFQVKETQNVTFRQDITKYKKQLKFMKKLIYLANENYQQLEQIYKKVCAKSNISSRNNLLHQKPLLILRQKRSENNLLTQRSASNMSKSSNNFKHIYSPLQNREKDNRNRFSPDQYCKDLSNSSYSPMSKGSKSIKSRKSISPHTYKDKQNIQSNNNTFKDIYRKMILKNMKSKTKQKLTPQDKQKPKQKQTKKV